jgi:hypothetical protein
LTRKEKDDRMLNYLKKIDKEVGDLRKEMVDIRKKIESNKLWDEMYDPTFVNVSNLFIFFTKKNYFAHNILNILKKKKIVNEIVNKTILETIYPSDEVLKAIAADYVIRKYPELFENWNDKRWTFYYDLTIQKKVSFIELHYNLNALIIDKRF